jgi:type IV pilus biogenesis protein PilP
MHGKTKVLVVGLLIITGQAVASELALPSVGELSAVQSETIMYEAKAKRAEAQAKMQENNLKAGIDISGPTAVASAVTAGELPTITGISGAAGRLYATFRYANGTTVTAKSGDQIAGGFRVAEVGIDRVVITRGDRRMPLQFGVATEPPEPKGQAQAWGAVPFMPPQPGQAY